jgi:hypothetical protein
MQAMIFQTSPKPNTDFPYALAQHPQVVHCPLDCQQPQSTAINNNAPKKRKKFQEGK